MEFSILMTFGMANSVNLWLPITTALTFVIYNNYTIQSIFNTSKMLLGIFLMKWKLISWLDSKVNENSRPLIEVMANILYSVSQTQFFFNYVCIFHHQGLVLLILSRINSPCIILLKTIKYLTLWTFLLVIFKV